MKDEAFRAWPESSGGFFPVTFHVVRSSDYTHEHRRMHTHPEYEILFTARGPMLCRAGGTVYRLNTGDFCFFRGNFPHRIESLDCDYEILHMDVHGMLFPRCEEWEDYLLMENRLPDSDIFPSDGSEISLLLTRLFDAIRERPVAFQLTVRGYLSELLALRVRRASESGAFGADEGKVNRRLRLALRYMQEHMSEKMTVADLAAVAGVSPNYFSRLFRSKLRQAPVSYLLSLRLETAARSLAETDIPVTEAALAAGFGDVSNFIRAFRRVYKKSPHQYRLTQQKQRAEIIDSGGRTLS